MYILLILVLFRVFTSHVNLILYFSVHPGPDGTQPPAYTSQPGIAPPPPMGNVIFLIFSLNGTDCQKLIFVFKRKINVHTRNCRSMLVHVLGELPKCNQNP